MKKKLVSQTGRCYICLGDNKRQEAGETVSAVPTVQMLINNDIGRWHQEEPGARGRDTKLATSAGGFETAIISTPIFNGTDLACT